MWEVVTFLVSSYGILFGETVSSLPHRLSRPEIHVFLTCLVRRRSGFV